MIKDYWYKIDEGNEVNGYTRIYEDGSKERKGSHLGVDCLAFDWLICKAFV